MSTEMKCPSKSKYDESRKMMASEYYGKEKIKVVEAPLPLITDSTDVIVKVTASSVSGSDLNLYHGLVSETSQGDILGHEAVGIVDQVGPNVKRFKKGDRVVISSVIACGECEHCKCDEWSICDTTNKSKLQKEKSGQSSFGQLGYSPKLGGYDGCQAEYVRVPYADVNLFPIPESISDKQALTVADLAATGYHGTELANIKEGDNVVIFGSGPVGLMAQMWSRFRGASKIVAIDCEPSRLEFAKKHFGSDTINSDEEDPLKAVQKRFPLGPNKVIDCVGSRLPESMLKKLQQTMKMESDSPNIVNSAIEMCRTGGTVTLLGNYVGYTNQFNLGALMEKHLTLNGGKVWPQKYYKLIFDAIKSKRVDPSIVFTHTFPLSKADEAYRVFDRHESGIIKPFLLPDSMMKQSTSS